MRQKLLIFFGIFLLLEFYIFEAVKIYLKKTLHRRIYWGVSLLLYIIIVFLAFSSRTDYPDQIKFQWIMTIGLGLIVPKFFIALFLLIDDIFRVGQFSINIITKKRKHLPTRRKFLHIMGISLAGIFSGLIFDGIIWGKYRHRVRRVRLNLKNLPKAFKGYKIIQISDVHSGSFSNPKKLQKAIDLINKQNADLVLFTGDMVNYRAEEFIPFIPLFTSINAKDGKYSVLGNHDYGGYYYKNQEEIEKNIHNLICYEAQAGFRNLRNEHFFIEKNNERLYIIGVENWGLPPFPQLGDLDKATEGIPSSATKILMSHDPTHFDEVVKKHPSDIALTLSGHTHGMQFGLDLKNIKWSPIQYKYPKWADLYESFGKYLYVNRGFGVLAFPGRVGIDPEITLFELY